MNLEEAINKIDELKKSLKFKEDILKELRKSYCEETVLIMDWEALVRQRDHWSNRCVEMTREIQKYRLILGDLRDGREEKDDS